MQDNAYHAPRLKGGKKQWLIGKLLAFFVKMLSSTLRYTLTVEGDALSFSKQTLPQGPVVWLFWHDAISVMPRLYPRILKKAPARALTSASRDGAIVASFLSSFGIGHVRGSSSRRATQALLSLRRALEKGDHLFITPDGPRGPRHTLQPGAIALASLSGRPLCALRISMENYWELKTWDRTRIPKPFSRVRIDASDFLYLPESLDASSREDWRLKVQKTLNKFEL